MSAEATRVLVGDAAPPVCPPAAPGPLDHARKVSLESIQALVRAVEAKDPFTRRHSEQVAHYAGHLAQAMGLPDAVRRTIHIAGLLHDIGKIGVPDSILTKPGPLTEKEYEQIRRHPALGGDILSNVTLLGAEAKLIRHHHERWDGMGYPDGLSGDETPLEARIIMLADCMDAMLMERTYKLGYSPEKMIMELLRCAGSQFEPRLACVAVHWCRGNGDKLILPENPAVAGAA